MKHVTFHCHLCGMPHRTWTSVPGIPSVPAVPETLVSYRDAANCWRLRCEDCSKVSRIGATGSLIVTSYGWIFNYGAEHTRRKGPSREVFTPETLLFIGDPRCPGCAKVHVRKRLGLSLTFDVKDPCDWAKKGKTIPFAKLSVQERLALVPES